MFKCESCDKSLSSLRGLQSHITQVHNSLKPRKDRRGPNNPMFGKKGSNQWVHFDWSTVPWDSIGYHRKRILLIEEANFACTQCGYDKRREDGGSILEVDHINGDHRDNAKENLRVLCPNCHALTPNFRNWGRSNKKTSTRLRRENKDFRT